MRQSPHLVTKYPVVSRYTVVGLSVFSLISGENARNTNFVADVGYEVSKSGVWVGVWRGGEGVGVSCLKS